MPSKSSSGYDGDAAHRDVALALAGQSARDERVRQHDRPGARRAGGEVGADAVHRRRHHGLVGAGRQVPGAGEDVGLEVGDAVDGDRAVLVVEQHGLVDATGVGAQVDPGEVDQPGVEAEAAAGVVVARGDHHPCSGGAQPVKGLVGQLDGVDGGQCPVVDVAGHDHEIDLLGLDRLDQVVDVRRLRGEEVLAVERPAQVPVGGVQDAHASTLGVGADRTPEHTPDSPTIRPA